MMRHVDVPDEIARELQKQARARKDYAKSKYIPVVAVIGGKSARTTIVPAGGGRHRMQINTAQRKAARVDWGDLVNVELRIDLASRRLSVPADLRVALASHPRARRGFDALPPGHRRQFLLWLAGAKRVEGRRKQLERALDHLVERATLGTFKRK